MPTPELRIRSWVRATNDELRGGLLGYLTLDFGPLVLDSLAVRRTADGRVTLSYPERRDRAGRRHAIFRPRDDAARRTLERAILGELALQQEVEP